ncbi:cyclic 2,3-diphosphoglycerate synthetase [Andreesenia angusta]|uniref:Cyclic 2,3-diphosphoglycerate synthetase n=1 Tax=Andreesenia angusta TaxID=39480 RepID=A0A1S1V773_9FIRM|nr:cyclic 2,3-diphosphoglycerate synthase [Andreesenia angusta]OHW62007.1 cyclic 2,3-diphosphoglycerate synthetase [Andreesenia angusta]
MDNIIIMGAAGRDFHNFNTYFRDNPDYRVVAFTANQIPGIENRTYPSSLCGKMYPEGIPILHECNLSEIIEQYNVDQVVFSYSDISHEDVMHKASLVLSCGADFRLLGPENTMIASSLPVIAVTGVRTGTGKSQTSKYICQMLIALGKKVSVIRHPMPYGDLEKQAVQKFSTYKDLRIHNCTIEEREEYEPYIELGMSVYAGIDYEKILRKAELESDVIVWDGGNNDLPFYFPDLHIVVADPHRPGDEQKFHPGEANLRMADAVIINKVDSAADGDVEAVRASVLSLNPDVELVLANSIISVEDGEVLREKSVLVVEDGPTLTHGNMPYGAGFLAAKMYGGVPVDPRVYATGSIADTFQKWSHLESVLPAMGYSEGQINDLEKTINNTPADLVLIGTPIDLARFIDIKKPTLRARYVLQEVQPLLEDIVKRVL